MLDMHMVIKSHTLNTCALSNLRIVVGLHRSGSTMGIAS